MNDAVMVIVLAILGASMGSFANATTWRLHAKKNFVSERSICEKCHRTLAWYDLIPVISWLSLGGKCRYCHKPIRREMVLTEIVLGLIFVLSYFWWPQTLDAALPLLLFGLWLLSVVMLTILFLYDLKWLLLPDRVVAPLIGVGVAMMTVRIIDAGSWLVLFDSFYSVVILSGLYLSLFLISKGKWVGFGDVKLGIFLGLGLGSWPLALLCLFLANFLGCLFVVPGMLTGKLKRTSRVPFGPFLIAGFAMTMLIGEKIIAWYMTYSGLL